MRKEISLSDIKPPTVYIRGEHDEGHVKDLRDVIQKHGDKAWPFDTPLIVMPLDKEEAVKRAMNGKSGKVHYELIDGFNRSLALVSEGWSKALCEVETFKSPADAYFAQFDANDHEVLKLTREARAAFIVRMRDEYKWTLAKIGERMKLTEASISRILRGLQATGKPKGRTGKRQKKARRSVATGTVVTNGAFKPLEWFTVLTKLVRLFETHKDDVLRNRSHFDPATAALVHGMAEALIGE